jgi:hypothetical protein
MDLRLLLFTECNRSCRLCCNKNFDTAALPIAEDFTKYDCIVLTGGEPMLNPELVKQTVARIRKQTDKPIVMYTAWAGDPEILLDVLNALDGITLTLHTRRDTEPFVKLNELIAERGLEGKSLRLNVFQGISTGGADVSAWKVKRGLRWIKDCPLPTNEEFWRI